MEKEMISSSYAKPYLNMNMNMNTSSHPNKRSRVERFKGVVPQQNGHWGAQIYANNKRIWLGTFNSEVEAAMAYDSAAVNLLSSDSHRNFPSPNLNLLENNFQSHFTTDLVLSMIRDGTYQSKFSHFLRNNKRGLTSPPSSSVHGFSCALLFQKELTPSDVGKLNRLVIPKRYAVKHFPNVPDSGDGRDFDGHRGVDEVQLEFYDRNMSLWKFRYCYWKSSQSFVFTRGWNRFVKEKGLRANDTIAFYTCERRDGTRQSILVIDVACRDTKTNELDNGKVEHVEDSDRDRPTLVEISASTTHAKGFRLFGFQIDHS